MKLNICENRKRKDRHFNYVGMRIYDLNNDIRRLSLSMNKQNDVTEKDIIKRIHFKLSLMNKYTRYLTKLRNS